MGNAYDKALKCVQQGDCVGLGKILEDATSNDTTQLSMEALRKLMEAAIPTDEMATRGTLDMLLNRAVGNRCVDVPNDNGDTLLHIAVARGFLGATASILAHGANPLARNRMGRTPLFFACKKGNADLAAMLLGHVTEESVAREDLQNEIAEAYTSGLSHIVKKLLVIGAPASISIQDPKSKQERSILYDAVVEGKLSLALAIIGSGRLNVQGTYGPHHEPLAVIAARCFNTEMLRCIKQTDTRWFSIIAPEAFVAFAESIAPPPPITAQLPPPLILTPEAIATASTLLNGSERSVMLSRTPSSMCPLSTALMILKGRANCEIYPLISIATEIFGGSAIANALAYDMVMAARALAIAEREKLATSTANNETSKRINGLETAVKTAQATIVDLRRKLKESQKRSDPICCICLEAPIEYMYKSCGHACVCSKCGPTYKGQCPICRKSNSGELARIYFAGIESSAPSCSSNTTC
jgi:hypothetical protein